MDFTDRLYMLTHGPAHLRFVLQPLLALVLGFQAGRLDARAGAAPYVLQLFTAKDRGALRKGLGQLLVPFTLATIIDAVVCQALFGRVFPASSLLIGVLLVGLPYALSRGAANRVIRRHSPATPQPSH